MVSWYSASEIAYYIHYQTIWSTYLDISWCVDLCVTDETKTCLFTVFVFIQDIVMSVSKTDHRDEPVLQSAQWLGWRHNISGLLEIKEIHKQIIWHSARKHNTSGLLEIIEIHKYTSQRHSVQNPWNAALWYKFVLFCPFRIKSDVVITLCFLAIMYSLENDLLSNMCWM